MYSIWPQNIFSLFIVSCSRFVFRVPTCFPQQIVLDKPLGIVTLAIRPSMQTSMRTRLCESLWVHALKGDSPTLRLRALNTGRPALRFRVAFISSIEGCTSEEKTQETKSATCIRPISYFRNMSRCSALPGLGIILLGGCGPRTMHTDSVSRTAIPQLEILHHHVLHRYTCVIRIDMYPSWLKIERPSGASVIHTL